MKIIILGFKNPKTGSLFVYQPKTFGKDLELRKFVTIGDNLTLKRVSPFPFQNWKESDEQSTEKYVRTYIEVEADIKQKTYKKMQYGPVQVHSFHNINVTILGECTTPFAYVREMQNIFGNKLDYDISLWIYKTPASSKAEEDIMRKMLEEHYDKTTRNRSFTLTKNTIPYIEMVTAKERESLNDPSLHINGLYSYQHINFDSLTIDEDLIDFATLDVSLKALLTILAQYCTDEKIFNNPKITADNILTIKESDPKLFSQICNGLPVLIKYEDLPEKITTRFKDLAEASLSINKSEITDKLRKEFQFPDMEFDEFFSDNMLPETQEVESDDWNDLDPYYDYDCDYDDYFDNPDYNITDYGTRMEYYYIGGGGTFTSPWFLQFDILNEYGIASLLRYSNNDEIKDLLPCLTDDLIDLIRTDY